MFSERGERDLGSAVLATIGSTVLEAIGAAVLEARGLSAIIQALSSIGLNERSIMFLERGERDLVVGCVVRRITSMEPEMAFARCIICLIGPLEMPRLSAAFLSITEVVRASSCLSSSTEEDLNQVAILGNCTPTLGPRLSLEVASMCSELLPNLGES